MALEQQQGKDSLLVLVTEKSGGRIRIGSHVLTQPRELGRRHQDRCRVQGRCSHAVPAQGRRSEAASNRRQSRLTSSPEGDARESGWPFSILDAAQP